MVFDERKLILISKNVRKSILTISNKKKSAHIGSNLSIVEILVFLYFKKLKHFSNNPNKINRDRFILSKGHACLSLYVVLSECGYFKKTLLNKYSDNGSILMSHVSHKVPGVEFSTGSLGHGINYSVGKAYFAKKMKKKWQTFVLISDGELNEGSTWESFLFSSHHRLNNLTIIIDNNKIQSLGRSKDIININPLKNKLKTLNFKVIEIDGHNFKNLNTALSVKSNLTKIIIANTIKGKGVKFMENKLLWHYKPPNEKELSLALEEQN